MRIHQKEHAKANRVNKECYKKQVHIPIKTMRWLVDDILIKKTNPADHPPISKNPNIQRQQLKAIKKKHQSTSKGQNKHKTKRPKKILNEY